MSIQEKIKHSHDIIQRALSISKKPFVAFSGGKDGLIVAHMLTQHDTNIKMVCEISHTFPAVLNDIKSITKQYNFQVEFVDSLDDLWLKKNSHFIFTHDTNIHKVFNSQRQQRTLKKFQKAGAYDCTFTGRTKHDNMVKAEIYTTKNHGLQAHPIREFTEQDVWDYFKHTNLRIPMIYKTKFGERTGNSPWFAMGYKNKGLSISKAWEYVNELDPEKSFYNEFKDYVKKDFC